MIRTLAALTLAVGASACASAVVAPKVTPAAPVAPVVAAVSFAERQSWILRLEDQRLLREPPSADPSQSVPDLLKLLTDTDARIRRRAALGVGRVGLKEGVTPLAALLDDGEPEVRQMAAFAMGLVGDPSAKDRLIAALSDTAPAVKASAAEALGLIGDASAAVPIARMAVQLLDAGGVTVAGADADDGRDTPAAAFRLALYALVRLKAYDALATVVFDAQGQLRLRSWPVAFALQRLEDPRALSALTTLAREADPYTRSFAVKGLGALKAREAVPLLMSVASGTDRASAVEAIRALGRIADGSAVPALVQIIEQPRPDQVLRVEAVAALGAIGGESVRDVLFDLVTDRNPAVRAAVFRSLAQLDPEGFVTVLSGLETDPQVTVRMALATILGTLPSESAQAALPRLRGMLEDTDARVVPPALTSLAKLHAPDVVAILLERLKADDAVVRAAAATSLGELKPAGAAAALAEAYRAASDSDSTYVAKGAILAALASYGAADALPVLNDALRDRDWAVRVRAAALLKQLDPSADVEARMRPAPTHLPTDDPRAMERLTNPPTSIQAFIETDAGLIQLELSVLDAPVTVDTFVALARKGFFDGVTFHRVVADFVVQGGDPRGDGEGGPGFTIRDELNQHAYLRGTMGMALDWKDTGGSQFFITHSPQPHLDGRYTVFGRVLAGMEVVDRIQQGDVIRRVTIWDGT